MDLNSREIAILFWLVVFFAAVSLKQDVRRSYGGVVRAFFQPQLLIPLGIAAGWILACITVLHWLEFWHWGDLKTTTVWAVTFAFLTMFQVERIREDRAYLVHLVRDLVGVTAVVTFVAELYVFNLALELALVPFLTLVTLMYVVAEAKPEHAAVRKLAEGILMVAGLIYVANGLYQVTGNFNRIATAETLRQFMMPVVLSLCYVPFIYGFAVYVTYESYFSRLTWLLEDATLRRQTKRLVIAAIRTDLDLLQRWWREFMRTRPASKEAVRRSIQRVKLRRKWEKNPPPIDPSEGWSPYEVKDLLIESGLFTGEYHPDISDSEWFASSSMLELGGSLIMPDNLAYYVEGNQHVAKRLKLKLNVNNPEDAAASEERFWLAGVRLLHALLSGSDADEVAAALWNADKLDRLVGDCHVCLWRDDFKGARSGYSRILQIEHRNPASGIGRAR